MNRLSKNSKFSMNVAGVTFLLLVSSAIGDVLGQDTTAPPVQSAISPGKLVTSLGKPNGKRWTVHCEREDGSQGIFRVSSDITDEASSLDLEAQPVTGSAAATDVEKPPVQKIDTEPTVSPKNEDPFGSPTLKCGRLLTLLAIFATGESQGH